MEKKIFPVQGMTCAGCERTLKHAVSGLEGVLLAEADAAKQELEVTFEPPCSEEAICAAVEAAGYTVAEAPQKTSHTLSILVILVGLFVIASQLGWTSFFSAFPVAGTQQMGYVMLFVLGLLTSLHCIVMCGGLNLSQSVTGEAHPLRRSLWYNLGRLTSYTLVGGLLGLIGEAAAITLRVRGIIGLAAGIFMILMGIQMLGQFRLLRRMSLRLPAPLARGLAALGKHGPYGIGLVNGLMPCGPLQAMQIYAIASGSFLAGASSMAVFCLGTIPLMLLVGVAAGLLRLGWKEKVLRVGAALLVLFGLFMVQNNVALTGISLPEWSAPAQSAVVCARVDGDTQYLTTRLRANGYDDLEVVAGIPVVWTILAGEDALNGCNRELVLPAFDLQVRLEEGENVITFTPEEPGTYSYSCWMGMLQNSIMVKEA